MTGTQTRMDFTKPIRPIQCEHTDRKRLTGQNALILKALLEGPKTSVQLAVIALKYTSRISDIRAAGYDVVAERIGATGSFRYSVRTKK